MNINIFLSKNKYTIFRYSPVVAISLIFIELLHLNVSDKPIQDFSPLVLYLICSLLLVFVLLLLRLLFEAGTTVYGWWKNTREDEISYDDAIDTKLEIDDIEKVTKIDVKNDQLRLDVAINYVTKVFEKKITAQELEILKELIEKHSKKEDIVSFNPIASHKFCVKDLRAFGWTIWYHFKSINDEKQEVFVEKFCTWFKAFEGRTFSTQFSHFAEDNLEGEIPKDSNLYVKYLPDKYKNKGNIKAAD